MSDDWGQGDEIIGATSPPPAAAPTTHRGRPRKPELPKQKPQTGDIVIFPGAPFDVAKTYTLHNHMHQGARTIQHHRGEFFLWDGAAFVPTDRETINARLFPWLASCKRYDQDEQLIPVLPSPELVGAVRESLRAAVQIDNNLETPMWLIQNDYPVRDLIACQNLILHFPTGQMHPCTPYLFNTNSVNFSYDQSAPPPRYWLNFLRELWPEDQRSIDTLQEWFGYCLADDTSQQKIFLLKGPKRSGKGTIARVLTEVVGKSNVAAPTLSALGGEFGLQPLIHKQLAIIGDARLGPKTDIASITERLLSISGEDMLNVNRKNKPFWIGTLRARFLIISNELPRFSDASGALASRFVILVLKNSFYGREDRGLFDKLKPELPGILNWSLAGLRRLRERGHFVIPEASEQAADDLDRLASPMLSFLRDNYVRGTDCDGVLVDDFCQQFRAWSTHNGREFSASNAIIGQLLGDIASHVERKQMRTGGRLPDGNHARQWWYIGLKPKPP